MFIVYCFVDTSVSQFPKKTRKNTNVLHNNNINIYSIMMNATAMTQATRTVLRKAAATPSSSSCCSSTMIACRSLSSSSSASSDSSISFGFYASQPRHTNNNKNGTIYRTFASTPSSSQKDVSFGFYATSTTQPTDYMARRAAAKQKAQQQPTVSTSCADSFSFYPSTGVATRRKPTVVSKTTTTTTATNNNHETMLSETEIAEYYNLPSAA